MSVVGGTSSGGLIARVQNILLKPRAEWDVIETEAASVQSLYMGYAAILAAIWAVAGAIGGLLPICFFGVFCVHLNPILVIVSAVVEYVLTLVATYLVGMVIDGLAPSFGGTSNPIAAQKVAVYSFTAAWVAGVLQIIPPLAPLAILGGLYSFYLMFVGLPKLMKSPDDKTPGYAAASIIAGIIVFAVVMYVGHMVASIGTGGPMARYTY